MILVCLIYLFFFNDHYFLNINNCQVQLGLGGEFGHAVGCASALCAEPFAKPLLAAGMGTAQLWSSTPRVREKRVAGLKAGDRSGKGAKFCVKSWCRS